MTVEDTNWVDPDILAMEGASSGFSQEDEQSFRVFFEKDWSDPKYDAMRGSWDPLIHDPEPKSGYMARWPYGIWLDYRLCVRVVPLK